MFSNDVFIIGWKGFIGFRYVEYLSRTGFSGNLFLYLREGEKENGIKSNNIYFLNHFEFIERLLISKATLYYLANIYLPNESLEYSIDSVTKNILPFIKILEEIKPNAKNIKFIFASSGGTIYGDTRGEHCKESHPLLAKSIYTANKIAQENYLSVYGINYGLNYHIVRIANPYGPGQKARSGQGLIPAIMDSIEKKIYLSVFGDGQALRDYLYIDDLCSFLFKLANYTGTHKIFNAGSGVSYSILDVIECFTLVSNKTVNYILREANISAVDKIVLDNSLAKKELRWEPKVSLKEGISAFIDWSENKRF
ncbi:NAD-dependent epimerase/dehydratase family protein [Xenorhabdus sp. KJ12.1]|uniref:NAD-dependent epimerase/dehydratase family protein n=1 Tax=Xenorhabdus sp. KJ12.1 TaxID=1851571 RepID=UPI000C03D0C9|nr:NAD-dependent epimerase/dehydratase family protein [Xenorhabdus sp. KJ12.1]PHM66414.1 UDP-glucose 4-epimerase [Xenorhabdus sp. KJ12.1]